LRLFALLLIPVVEADNEGADGVKQLGFFGGIRDLNVALVRSDELVDKIRKSTVQSLAADNDELPFASDFLGGCNYVLKLALSHVEWSWRFPLR